MFARRRAVVVAALMSSTALAVAPLAAQTNYVTNGGFETGDLTGWQTQLVCQSFAVNSTSALTGSYGAFADLSRLIGVPGGGCIGIAQGVALPAGSTYTFSFDAFVSGDATGASLRYVLGNNDVTLTNLAGAGWTHITSSGQPSTSPNAIFFAFGSTGSVMIDNVSAVADANTAPEPSSLALLGTGLVGLVPIVRRRVLAS